MDFTEVKQDKKRFLTLLLMADEQEDMIDRYLERGEMFVLTDGGEVCGVCVVTDEGGGMFEIKNLAVSPERRRQGLGREMIAQVCALYSGRGETLRVGTGDSPLTIPFYESCGFREVGRIKNFFTEGYDHPIFECGRQLTDMVVLQMPIIGGTAQ